MDLKTQVTSLIFHLKYLESLSTVSKQRKIHFCFVFQLDIDMLFFACWRIMNHKQQEFVGQPFSKN